jgi:hypothetical protein
MYSAYTPAPSELTASSSRKFPALRQISGPEGRALTSPRLKIPELDATTRGLKNLIAASSTDGPSALDGVGGFFYS